VHRVEAEHAAWRAHGVSRDGARRMGRSTKPVTLTTDAPTASTNTTDPDSRTLKSPRGYVQGYNAPWCRIAV
jgi:hypothetical protein